MCAGHWKLGHTKRNLVMVQVVLFLQFALFGLIRTAPGLFRSFGFVHRQPAFIAFTLFQLIIGPLDEVGSRENSKGQGSQPQKTPQDMITIKTISSPTLCTAPGLFRSFGFVHRQPAFIAFTLFQLIVRYLNEEHSTAMNEENLT